MSEIKRVCVYCASSDKLDKKYFHATETIARVLVKNNTTVVYGGGASGLMGRLADTVLEEKGNIVGIMPHFMKEVEYNHKGVNEFVFTADMHERKKKFMVGVDALITLPGGCGTFEEFMEAVILNLDGYYDKMLEMMDHAVGCGFLSERHLDIWTVFENPEKVLEAIAASKPWSPDAIKFAQV